MKKKKFSCKIKTVFNGNTLPFAVTSKVYKIYKDGNHFVGTRCLPHRTKRNSAFAGLTDEQIYFDELYKFAVAENLTKSKKSSFLRAEMKKEYPEMEGLNEFVDKNTNRNWHNYYSRLKRFRRKANLNIWNKFVTITYDSRKMTETTFRQKLRKCLSNLHSRRNWRYMGVFERGEDNDRLHFHALMYIPEGQMIGSVIEKQDYSTKQHKMQTTHSNTFFFETFGRNDFDDIEQQEIANGDAVKYITKYISKTGEKIVYSRGIPSEIYKEIEDDDIVTTMVDYETKYIFFDDVLDLEIDVMGFRRVQASFFDDFYVLTG